MVRRRAAAGRRLLPLALLIVIGGLAAGLLLARPARQAGPPVPELPPPAATPEPAPLFRPAGPTTQVITVDDRAVAAAVRRSLAPLGEVVAETEVMQSERAGDVLLRWRVHRIELRTRRSPEEILRAVGPEITRAGGAVFTRGSPMTFGITREERRVVTHELRLVRPRATAQVAIIFDDAGGSLDDIEAIIALGRPVTVAVLPGLRFSREAAERTRAAGLEVFLHLPLEAEDATKPMGPGGIEGWMSDEEIVATVRAGLASVPGAAGVNNHMGSRGTADERIMRAVLAEVKARGLIWVDSRTTLATLGARLAAEIGIPTASRQVFLDNDEDPVAIRSQVRRLLDRARREGQAIAIGHAHRQTAQVLREMLSEFDRVGIQFVPASALAR